MDHVAPDTEVFRGDSSVPEPVSGQLPCPCISLEAEVPELLFEGMRRFIRHNPSWDQYSVITAALADFLFQNGCQDRHVTQHYLDGLFLRR